MNKKIKSLILILIPIIFVYLIHFMINNPVLKTYSQVYFNYDIVKRPISTCDDFENRNSLYCIGMPSGHSESIAVLSFLLYFYKLIPFWGCIALIFLQVFQRVYTKMHSITQVTIGCTIGFLYACMYKYFNISILSILITFFIQMFVFSLCIYKIQNKIDNNNIPKWVDQNKLQKIKLNSASLYHKFISLYYNAYYQRKTYTYLDWISLEKYLDILAENISETNINYDTIINMNSESSLISDYLSQKLNIINFDIDINNINIEGINGQNIILLDFDIQDDIKIKKILNYLNENKKINNVNIASISCKESLYNKFNIISATKKYTTVWPWGFNLN